jgi:hypothetical protein
VRSRIPPALALLAAAVAGVVAYAQPRPGPAPVYDPPPPASAAQHAQPGDAAPRSSPSLQSSPPVTTPVVPVGDLPLDTLVAELKGMRAQKAALARREAEVAAEVRRRLEDYTGTLEKLGFTGPRAAGSEPPAGPRQVRPVGGGRGTTDETTTRTRNEYVPYAEPPAPPEPAIPPVTSRRRSPVPLPEPAPAAPQPAPLPPSGPNP